MRSAAGRSQTEAIGVKLCRWSEELVYEISSVIVNVAAVDPGPLAAKVEEQAAIMRDQVSY